MKKQGKETALVRQMLEYLAHRKVWAYRVNTGGLLDKTGRLVRFGTPGHPDITARLRPVHPDSGSGRVLWIEAKSEKGRLSPAQKEWQKKAEEYGDVYIVARSVEDVMCLFEVPRQTGMPGNEPRMPQDGFGGLGKGGNKW